MSDPLTISRVPISSLHKDDKNSRVHSKKNLEAIKASLKEFGQQKPIVVDADGRVIAGNGTLDAALALGWTEIDVTRTALTGARARAFAVADNRTAELAVWDDAMLAEALAEIETDESFKSICTGFTEAEIERAINKGTGAGGGFGGGDLLADFLAPPFSVLDARQGYWQERKKAWIEIGIQGESGRDKHLLKFSRTAATANPESVSGEESYTSIFDPVLCELLCLWFSPPGGRILDPFAGGSVRGVVASLLGRGYVGIDLRPEQIEANRAQWKEISSRRGSDAEPKWIHGDSRSIDSLLPGEAFDFLFSCPPYMDLEKYSEDPSDISNFPPEEFLAAYREIIRKGVALLREDSFAAFVVGEVRGTSGTYRGLVPETIRAFEESGASYYNEAILVTAIGSLPIRVRKQFEASRKIGKTHQNVLIFCKGDPVKATSQCGPVKILDLPDEEEAHLA